MLSAVSDISSKFCSLVLLSLQRNVFTLFFWLNLWWLSSVSVSTIICFLSTALYYFTVVRSWSTFMWQKMTLPCVRHTCSAQLDAFLNEFLFHVTPAIHFSCSSIWMMHMLCVCVHRLIVSAKPLNITYNPTALRQVLDYFSIRKSACRSHDIESRLAC